ncbi:MAG: zinc ribbon domain-containing protein [Kiritimatiellae bacterium]|nr:zinc ribbon domain-containing protein [Kiritimatiellia bacterium]
MTAKFCKQCGAPLNTGAAFCGGCGARFEAPAPAMSSPWAGGASRPAMASPFESAGAAGRGAARAVSAAAQIFKGGGAMKGLAPPRWNVVVGETLPSPMDLLKAKAGEILRGPVRKLADAARQAVSAPAPASPAPRAAGSFCAGCGAALKPGARFCGHCGNRLA